MIRSGTSWLLLISCASGGRLSGQAVPLAPIPASYGLPRGDSVLTFSPSNEPEVRGYRQFIEIRFRDSVSNPSFQSFLRAYQATVVGGSRAAGTYILRFPDPGPSYQVMTRFILRLRADPRVASADGIEYSLPFSPPSGSRSSVITPDSIPAWVYADSNLVRDDTLVTGVFPRGVVFAGFSASASSQDLAALLDSVGVEVIGGKPLPSVVRTLAGERSGYFVLALRGDRSTVRMMEVVRRLRASPLVTIAFIDYQVSN